MSDFLVIEQQEILAQGGEDTVLQEEQLVIEVLAVAEQGPPGRDGVSGNSSYEHLQSMPSTVWTVPHNLGRYPGITVVNLLGEEVLSDVRYLDANIVQVTHSTPFIGRVFCN